MDAEIRTVEETERWIEERVKRGIQRSWTRTDQFYLITVQVTVRLMSPEPMAVRVRAVALPNDFGHPVTVDAEDSRVTLSGLRALGGELGAELQKTFSTQLDKEDDGL